MKSKKLTELEEKLRIAQAHEDWYISMLIHIAINKEENVTKPNRIYTATHK